MDPVTDLGGAIMQSILGGILKAGWVRKIVGERSLSSPNASEVTPETQAALTKSFSSAEVQVER